MRTFQKIFVGAFAILLFANSALAIKSGVMPGASCGKADNPCFAVPKAEEGVPHELVHAEKSPRQVILNFINYFLSFAGLIAVAAFVYSGFLWVTSLGNQEQFEKGQ